MSGNTMTVVRLTDIAKIPTSELQRLGQRIAVHVMETFDEEECENGNIILAEIEKKLTNAQ